MASLRVQNAPQPGAPQSASQDSVGELARLLVTRILESRPKSPSLSDGGADEEILYEAEFGGARYLLVRVKTLNLTKVCLSPREQEIVRMVAEGHPNKVIADVLSISAWTVCTHLRRIFAKLGVASRAAMVARVLEPPHKSVSKSRTPVAPLFDIFQVDNNGSLIWCESANTLEIAHAHSQNLAAGTAKQYILVNRATGERMPVGTPIAQRSRPLVTRAAYHICRIDKEKLRSVESADSLENAELRVKSLKKACPGNYAVLDYDPETCDSLPPWVPISCVLAT